MNIFNQMKCISNFELANFQSSISYEQYESHYNNFQKQFQKMLISNLKLSKKKILKLLFSNVLRFIFSVFQFTHCEN